VGDCIDSVEVPINSATASTACNSPVELGLIATRKIITEQCQHVPDRVKVVGGALREDIGRGRYDRFASTSQDLEYWQYYSGTFNPKQLDQRLARDDPALAATYDQIASVRRQYVAA